MYIYIQLLGLNGGLGANVAITAMVPQPSISSPGNEELSDDKQVKTRSRGCASGSNTEDEEQGCQMEGGCCKSRSTADHTFYRCYHVVCNYQALEVKIPNVNLVHEARFLVTRRNSCSRR